MSRSSILIVLGIIGILIPFSGIPVSARSFLGVTVSVVVLAIGVSLRSRESHKVEPRLE